jgi:[FeFe] hydrogenase H-cluster maturation GTPase HydF
MKTNLLSMNETARANRLHIALLGITNAGKSSLINALTEQELALVSPVKGTTTDPVYKAMELFPLGPVVFIDTAGLDDTSELGELRKKKTFEVLQKTDLAILVFDAAIGVTAFDREILQHLKGKKIPVLGVLNKIDLFSIGKKEPAEAAPEIQAKVAAIEKEFDLKIIPVSTETGQGVQELKVFLGQFALPEAEERLLVADLLHAGEIGVLVTPIDASAPKGRLILPQQQTLREMLDHHIIAVVCQDTYLKDTLAKLSELPHLVITDAQVFQKVNADMPANIPLTAFSILFARYKGDLKELVKGAQTVEKLQDGDKILIAEACTHHRQDDDIGTVKIPRWLRQKTGKKLIFEHTSGYSFPNNLSEYALIVHCAGCMLNRRAMLYRLSQAQAAGIPIVNYGVLIASLHGILERALEPFQELFR